MPEHIAAPSSTNCERRPTPPGHESVIRVCACTEAAVTGLDEVCVECGGEPWTKKMLIHTHKPKPTYIQQNLNQGTLPSYPSRYTSIEFLFPLVKEKARFARAPHKKTLNWCSVCYASFSVYNTCPNLTCIVAFRLYCEGVVYSTVTAKEKRRIY